MTIITGRPLLIESEALQIYTHAQTVFTLSGVINTNRGEHVRATQIIKHKNMLIMCNHVYSTVVELRFQTRRAIGQ